jgi:uncharacterized protein YjbI with pentapeptide repeats
MKIENENHRMEVHKADLSGSEFDDVNLSRSDFRNINMSGSFDALNMCGRRVHNATLFGLQVEKANLAGASFVDACPEWATMEGVSVTDLPAYWRAGHEANNA